MGILQRDSNLSVIEGRIKLCTNVSGVQLIRSFNFFMQNISYFLQYISYHSLSVMFHI